jgi:hypothetical protein
MQELPEEGQLALAYMPVVQASRFFILIMKKRRIYHE